MLKIVSKNKNSNCEKISRRNFLEIGSLSVIGLSLADLEAQEVTRNKSVVWLQLGGGVTHVETFNPVPDAPVEFRSVNGAVRTNVPGLLLGGNFKNLARKANDIAVVRSFSHNNNGHSGGTHWVMTARDHIAADQGASPSQPSHGSILSRYRGATNERNLPNYVKINNTYADGAVWLGNQYGPFASSGEGANNLRLLISENQLQERRNLLQSFDSANRQIDRASIEAMTEFNRQAFDLVLGQARQVFDVSNEPRHILNKYGNGLGRNLLLARRLVENGVGFVTINHGGWDHHSGIEDSMNRMVPDLDSSLAAFIDDVVQRGLKNDVLLVITGEFGRTPRINGTAGRDHWANLSTLAFALGNCNGQIIGRSDNKAQYPVERKISPMDLRATVFQFLGIPLDIHYNDNSGRPIPLVYGGTPIREVI